jgi:N-acetylmuramic acid 6-phosphate etherase
MRPTEQPSPHRDLEQKSIEEITTLINEEDKTVAMAVERALPELNRLIAAIVDKLKAGGRMFYLGAGAGGRLAVLDVVELPTTFGISRGMIDIVLSGGVERLYEAPEELEDEPDTGWLELKARHISQKDIVVGISASGTTPFVLGALRGCRAEGISTGCVVSNPQSPIAAFSDFPVEVITGPEFITGSTRMKCGTAQKMVLDIISTTTMIMMGRVRDNKMVHVMLINDKITDRAVRILMDMGGLQDYESARSLLIEKGSVQQALDYLSEGNSHP